MILSEMGIEFDVIKADLDERAIGDRSNADCAPSLGRKMLLSRIRKNH